MDKAAAPCKPAPLLFKPDLQEADRRFKAFYVGDLIDRPPCCITAPRRGGTLPSRLTYYDRVHKEIDEILDTTLAAAELTYYGGEALPKFWPSFATDEVAAFCGGEIKWSQDSGDTNWSVPFVDNWESALPLRLQEDNPLWQRMRKLLRRCSERLAGKMLVMPLDLHTNMDLLMAVRGSERLCMDLVDQPEMIDQAMESARQIFRDLWEAITSDAKMYELGFAHDVYSMEGAATLQCDFSCMIGPDMFRRWVLPALEEEASIVKHVMYHWDGPDAVKHADDLIASKGLHTLGYVPGAGNGTFLDHLDLLQKVQQGGKAVYVWGPPERLMAIHPHLKPEKTLYWSWAKTEDEARRFIDWLAKNT